MHIPILFVGGTEADRRQQAEAYMASYTVSSFDLHRVTPTEVKKSIGISQIKSLIQELLLSPVRGTKKIGIIYELHSATTEAQNALLKLLEEPHETTILVATASRKEAVLPTIVSRCRIKTVQTEEHGNPTRGEITELERIISSDDGKRMVFAERITSDHEAVKWIANALYVLHDKLRTTVLQNSIPHPEYEIRIVNMIRALDRARITLEKTNTNQRLLMENLLLSLDQIPFQ
ncbi:MAG: hypothetical protein NUV98_01860 [Candidatus Roizmanbacteria bacterium]|nr:hypothetical protein [Candidatus Roizmanbacteria bacterium]